MLLPKHDTELTSFLMSVQYNSITISIILITQYAPVQSLIKQGNSYRHRTQSCCALHN